MPRETTPDNPQERLRGVIDQIDDRLLISLGYLSTFQSKITEHSEEPQFSWYYAKEMVESLDYINALVDDRFIQTNAIGVLKYRRSKVTTADFSGLSNARPVINVRHRDREDSIISRMQTEAVENKLNLNQEFIERFWTGLMWHSRKRQRYTIKVEEAKDAQLG